MKRLFTIDLKDYIPDGRRIVRPSVRGIVFDRDGNVAMIYSQRYHFYKFPGGGIEGDETHLETLAREMREETGLTLIPESVKEFGEVLKIQNGDKAGKDAVHIQQNYYYTCEVKDEKGEQDLEEDEKELDFVLRFVPIDDAIAANAIFESDDPFIKQMSERDKRVLELIKDAF